LKKVRGPLIAFTLGLVLVLLVVEVSLRLIGVTTFLAKNRLPSTVGMDVDTVKPAPPLDPEAFRVLCVGNSHTQGAAETLEGAFPPQLEKLLQEKHPGKKFQVFNTGRGNWNSSEVLEYLPGFLEKFRPHVVFAMIGEPNAWNYRYFYKQQSSIAWAFDHLRLLKTVRLLDLLRRFNPEGDRPRPDGSMVTASLDLPWFEYPMLAMSWVAHISTHPDLSDLPKGDVRVAAEALGKWVNHPKGLGRRLALVTLLRLQLQEGKTSEAFATAKKVLALPGKPFDLRFLHAVSGLGGDFEAVEREMRARLPFPEQLARLEKTVGSGEALPDPKSLKPLDRENEKAFAELAAISVPGTRRFYEAVVGHARLSGDINKIKEVYKTASIENPHGDGMQAFLGSITEIAERDRFDITFGNAVPLFTAFEGGVFGEKLRVAIGSSMASDELDAEFRKVQGWADADLRRTAELVQDSGAKLVLQTYPRYRKSRNERWPDPLIRAVSRELGIPLSDTSEAFAAIFRTQDPEAFYYKKNAIVQDDHLNTAGNALVAGIMHDKLLELGLLK